MSKYKKIKDETDSDIDVYVMWLDGYLETFSARQIRISESKIWIRQTNFQNRNIPLTNVRWYSTYPEIHGDDNGGSNG